MAITVKYFASLREQLGKDEDQFPYENFETAKDVWNKATTSQPVLPNMLVAINMEYADLKAKVKDGDEVAFFPPVTGG